MARGGVRVRPHLGHHVEHDAVRHRRGRGRAPLACEHRQLAEVAAGHERAIDDAAVGDLHGALFEKVHRVARVVQLEGTVALEQHLVRVRVRGQG